MTYDEWLEGLCQAVVIARYPNVGQGKKGFWWLSLDAEGKKNIVDLAMHTVKTAELDENDTTAVRKMWGNCGPTPAYLAVLVRQCAAARKYIKEVPKP